MALYHTVNGSPVEVKKHQLMGPVGYTKVGSPTIVDGVLIEPGNSNYVKTSTDFVSGNYNDIEIYSRFKTASQFNSGWTVFLRGLDWDSKGYLGVYNDGNIVFFGIFGVDLSAVQAAANTWYRAKCVIEGNSQTVYVYDDNNNLLGSYSSTKNINTSYFHIGAYQNSASIDLNNTYIKVNGKLWFYQPAPTKYIIREDKDTHEQKLVFADQGLYLAGPVNYTVVGSPTITDGVVSGFSGSDYLRSSLSFNTSTPFSAKVTFTPSSATTGSKFFFTLTSSSNYIGFYTAGSTPRIDAYYTGASYWNGIAMNLSYNVPIELNLFSDASELTVSITQEGNTQTKTKSLVELGLSNKDITFVFGRGNDTYQPLVNGSIDLNETYIKVNGQLWFYGKNYASKNIAPVPGGYTLNNTSHPYIGYYDMRDQSYHQAPAGTALVSSDGKATYDDYVIEDNKLVAVNPNIYLRDISSTGALAGNTFYIDTGVTPTNKTTFEIAMEREDVSGVSQINSSPIYVGGGTVGDIAYKAFGFQLQNSNRFFYFSSTDNVGTMSYATLFNGKKKVWKSTLESSSYIIKTYEDDVLIDTITCSTVTDQSARSTLYLGCQNLNINGNPRPYYSFVGKIYYAKFYEDGVLIRHFVPVEQEVLPSITANGMFDMVNQQFYANQGTGTFTIGRDE